MFIFCLWHEKILYMWHHCAERCTIHVHMFSCIWLLKCFGWWRCLCPERPVNMCPHVFTACSNNTMQRGRHHFSWNLWVMACHTVPSTNGWKKKPTKVSLWGKFICTKSGQGFDLWYNLVSDLLPSKLKTLPSALPVWWSKCFYFLLPDGPCVSVSTELYESCIADQVWRLM